jgi:HD-like signal output (HDOD) protein
MVRAKPAGLLVPRAVKRVSNSTLEFLLRRMRNKSDFPALSESVVRIQSMATSEKESISSVTNEILKDVALTNKFLRLVNSAHYARGNSIGTVSTGGHPGRLQRHSQHGIEPGAA